MNRSNSATRTTIWTATLVAMAAVSLIAFVPVADAGPKGTNRPLAYVCDNDVTPLSPPGSFPILLQVDLTCHMSHLGLTVGFTNTEVIVPAGPPVGSALPVFITVARIVYVAANGDQLYSRFEGTGELDFASGRATFDGIETFTGGTGRFSHATGQSHSAGEGSLITNQATLAAAGTISY